MHCKHAFALCLGLVLLAGCTDPGYRPSSQAVGAVHALRDIEYAGKYMITSFNPCGTTQTNKKSGYRAGIELDEDGNITPEAQIRTSGEC